PTLVLLLLSPRPSYTARYTLSLHDALPILSDLDVIQVPPFLVVAGLHLKQFGVGAALVQKFLVGAFLSDAPVLDKEDAVAKAGGDRKSTRLNSSHVSISYAVFCSKKKKTNN